MASASPNLQNIPRPGKPTDPQTWIKDIFVAPRGSQFVARDFSGIEAVLVGYFAGSARYTRLARLGVHAFLCAHLVGEPAELSWSDDDLRGHFKLIKGRFKSQYDIAKRTIHASNYRTTPKHIHDIYPETFPTIKAARDAQAFYFDLFPEIPAWHTSLCLRVDAARVRRPEPDARVDPWTLGVAYARNPFGYVHRFYHVLDWTKIGDEWVWSLGDDAKRLIAFLPQSTAAAIIKRAARIIWEDYPWVGELIRLIIHDELFFEAKDEQVEMVLEVTQQVMESPIPELPLDPSWGLGSCLSIGTEPKVGRVWSQMK